MELPDVPRHVVTRDLTAPRQITVKGALFLLLGLPLRSSVCHRRRVKRTVQKTLKIVAELFA